MKKITINFQTNDGEDVTVTLMGTVTIQSRDHNMGVTNNVRPAQTVTSWYNNLPNGAQPNAQPQTPQQQQFNNQQQQAQPLPVTFQPIDANNQPARTQQQIYQNHQLLQQRQFQENQLAQLKQFQANNAQAQANNGQVNNVTHVLAAETPILCQCGLPVIHKIVKKNGDNFNRPYMACAKFGNKNQNPCSFFEWTDGGN